ncbi:MAG TPA: Rid family detoxifying hydrolase [archaeon]|nr:Rid family detoxifying hydrolase [archaeon]
MPGKSKLPAPKGPYSLWVKAGGFIYVSGQGPVDPETGEVFLGAIEEQTRITLKNVAAVLEDAGASLRDVVKTIVFLTDIGNFSRMNEVYAKAFGDTRPARSCVEVAALPLGISVEIEAVAADPGAGVQVVRR